MGFQFVMKGEQREEHGQRQGERGRWQREQVMAVTQRLENGQSQKNKVVLDWPKPSEKSGSQPSPQSRRSWQRSRKEVREDQGRTVSSNRDRVLCSRCHKNPWASSPSRKAIDDCFQVWPLVGWKAPGTVLSRWAAQVRLIWDLDI